MPANSLDKRRKTNRESEQRRRDKEKLEKLGITPENFDLQVYLRSELPSIARTLVDTIKNRKSARSIELALKSLGELIEKKEEKLTIEFTHSDKIKLANEIIHSLRDTYRRTGGTCAVCGRPQVLLDQPCVDTEPELAEGGEVEALALSA